MTAPLSLQRYADKPTKSKFRDTEKLWDMFQKINKQLATQCATENSKGSLNQQIMDAVTASYDKLRKDSSNRGRKFLLKRQALPCWHSRGQSSKVSAGLEQEETLP